VDVGAARVLALFITAELAWHGRVLTDILLMCTTFTNTCFSLDISRIIGNCPFYIVLMGTLKVNIFS